ncbi:MAG: hypothetical protein V9E87_16745 [Gemmatimonadales bacterium]
MTRIGILGLAGEAARLGAGAALAEPVGHHPAGVGVRQVQQRDFALVAPQVRLLERLRDHPQHLARVGQRLDFQRVARQLGVGRVGGLGRLGPERARACPQGNPDDQPEANADAFGDWDDSLGLACNREDAAYLRNSTEMQPIVHPD